MVELKRQASPFTGFKEDDQGLWTGGLFRRKEEAVGLAGDFQALDSISNHPARDLRIPADIIRDALDGPDSIPGIVQGTTRD
jgi:hypothetical protein